VKGFSIVPAQGAIGAGELVVDALGLVTRPAVSVIVPLYIYPGGNGWQPLINAQRAHPTVATLAIVNPNSGPGATLNVDYAAGIAALIDAGVTPIGYVPTTYGARDAGAVKADVALYRQLYPSTRGIFVDEMSSALGTQSYYDDIHAYALDAGFSITLGNPGAGIATALQSTGEMFGVYENAGVPNDGTLSTISAGFNRQQLFTLSYALPEIDRSWVARARRRVGGIYLTDAPAADPWASFPSYLDGLYQELR
jgi:hypothetical protein